MDILKKTVQRICTVSPSEEKQHTFSSVYGSLFNLKLATQLHDGKNIIHITSQQIKNTQMLASKHKRQYTETVLQIQIFSEKLLS
jgi:hypothetical protein